MSAAFCLHTNYITYFKPGFEPYPRNARNARSKKRLAKEIQEGPKIGTIFVSLNFTKY